MLTALSVRDVLLIERLDLEFGNGLTVLTGETGAGKSILLDSLGLALGMRARSGLVRANAEKAEVSAEFLLPKDHAVAAVLDEYEIDMEDGIVLRRVLKADGGSRAWVNGMAVPAAVLRDIGAALVEIHGQHDERGLLDPRGHRQLLDLYGGHERDLDAYAAAFNKLKDAEAELAKAEAAKEAADKDREYVAQALEELRAFAPQEGEEEELAGRRSVMLAGQRIAEDLESVIDEFSGSDGALARLRSAARLLGRTADAHGGLGGALEAVDRALIELDNAESQVMSAAEELAFDQQAIDEVETRLFELRALARKYRVAGDELPAALAAFEVQRGEADAGKQRIEALRTGRDEAKVQLVAAAKTLSIARNASAGRLDKMVASELPPLKLEAARFRTVVETLPEANWTSEGADRVHFEIATNPGSDFGPLVAIASGGELSRFILALKVALAAEGEAGTMIFDEIDRGVGGATASAIGERLARLSSESQVLVVTHSPQVAASGDVHFRISKSAEGTVAVTDVEPLHDEARREEIARMLSGAAVTDEARAQASRLLVREG